MMGEKISELKELAGRVNDYLLGCVIFNTIPSTLPLCKKFVAY